MCFSYRCWWGERQKSYRELGSGLVFPACRRRELRGVLGWDIVRELDRETELATAEGEFVARSDAGGAGNFTSAQDRAVFRGHIVDFTTAVTVNHNRTMSPRDMFVPNHNRVVRQSPDRVDAHTEWVRFVAVVQPVRLRQPERHNQRRTVAGIVGRQKWQVADKCVFPAGHLELLPRSPKLIPPVSETFQVQTVQSRIGHGEASDQW